MYNYAPFFVLVLLAVLTSAGKYGPGEAPLETYDYIIVGSGNSGSVVAKRLTDDRRNFKVVVLEAGFPSQSDLGGTEFVAARYNTDANGKYVPARPLTVFDVPSFYLTTYNNGQALTERGYVPVQADWGITGNYLVAQGKIIGGSGCHNGNAWVRGDKGVFALWNVTGWSYDDLLPYYKKSENCTYAGSFQFPSVHNFSGPIQITDQSEISQEANITIATCIAAGLGKLSDVNAQTTGCGLYPNSIRRGIRDSAALRYLYTNIDKPNLDVVYYAQATKVLFKENRRSVPRATGVVYVDLLTNRTYTIFADKEVILAAGPLNTPKLLWFSGIGPADELNKWNISVLINNRNVGRHIRNGFTIPVVVNSPKSVFPNINFVANAALEYAQKGTGWYATPQAGANGLVKTNPNFTYADVSFFDRYVYPPYANQLHAFSVVPSSPLYANGNITLNSSNPLDPCHLYQPLFTHPEDIATAIKGIRVVRDLLSHEPAASFFGAEVTPGANITSDADLEAYIRASANTLQHFTGSCKMGNRGDPRAVVDPKLRVLDVKRLRIVDTSINAGPLRGGNFPHATSIAVAEKAAALILADA